jgi:hypothetical protein
MAKACAQIGFDPPRELLASSMHDEQSQEATRLIFESIEGCQVLLEIGLDT